MSDDRENRDIWEMLQNSDGPLRSLDIVSPQEGFREFEAYLDGS